MQLLGQETLRRAKSIRGWQDSCAVHDLRASDGENAPWRQDVRAVYSPRTLCGAFRMHSTHILPKLAVFEYMAAIYCHEPALFPSEAPSGTHRGDILPRPAARERIRAQSCHGRQLENASGRYLVMARRRMIATEVHRRPISDCNGLLGAEVRGVSDTESRDSKRLSFVQLKRSETSRKSFDFQHLRVRQVTKRGLAPFCHFFVAHVSIMN